MHLGRRTKVYMPLDSGKASGFDKWISHAKRGHPGSNERPVFLVGQPDVARVIRWSDGYCVADLMRVS